MSNPSETMNPADLAVVTTTGDTPERALIARAAAGDLEAAHSLYRAHAARVHRLAYRMCGDTDLAADMVQDVFIRVFAQLKSFRGESAFTTWLHRVTVTTCLNTLRKVKRFHTREVELDEAVNTSAKGGIDAETRSSLHRAIESLPDGLRIALVMHAFEGYTHAEIGAALGIAEGTSKSRVFEARGRLRELLGSLREE